MAIIKANMTHVHRQVLPKVSKPPFRGAIVLKVRGPVTQLLLTLGEKFFHISNIGAYVCELKLYTNFSSFFKSEGLEIIRYIRIGARNS